MRVGLEAFLAATCALPAICTAGAGEDPLRGIYDIVKRRIPNHVHDFTFSLVNGPGDSFVITDTDSHQGGITVSCSTASACARGLYTYVTEYGGVDIWWTGSRLNELPHKLPPVRTPVNGSSIVPYRYYFNTVTFGYTTAFWEFDNWSLLLDWMALRGVNLPLAWVGYEAILAETFRDVGLSDAEITSFFSGPAFLPWNRFGNIQGSWGGDLLKKWNEDQLALQKQIVARMVELGMTPILPSFTGFVPRALSQHYPEAAIINGSQWEAFPSTLTNVSFLEPFDPLFTTLQTSFISKQKAVYGDISHFYTLDQYNENDPYSGDLDYLANVTAGTFASLRAADPEAIWVMQGWLFFSSQNFWTNERIKYYLGGVPGDDSMLILDLYSEAQPQWNRTSSYFGKNWVWCELHDYGGNMGMEGNLPELTVGPITALNSPNSSMKGMGLTMEGQELGNELVYDLLLDQAWSSSPLSIPSYMKKWVSRRYHVSSLPDAAQKAWSILSSTVYSNQDPGSQATIKSIFELSPSISGLVNRTGHHPTRVPYDTNTTIVPALQLLIKASAENHELRSIPEFVFDAVDVARQLVANRFVDYYQKLVDTFNSNDSTPAEVKASGQPLVSLLNDLDDLLVTNENYLLSTWIADARQWAHGDKGYAQYLEYNARNQITLWGPTGQINDYGSKQWAGLVGGYYAVRWQTFVVYLEGLKESRQTYNATEVSQKMLSIGEVWSNGTWGQNPGEGWSPRGDTFRQIGSIIKRWA